MQKKSFKNNPALQFISAPESNAEEREDESVLTATEPPEVIEIQEEKVKTVVNGQGRMVPVKLNPLYVETKSKRLQLLMQPTLHGELKAAAVKKGISVNDLIHKALEIYVGNLKDI